MSSERSGKYCAACAGSGKRLCATCSGMGRKWAALTRQAFRDGRYVVETRHEQQTCAGCEGAGAKTCALCGGRGRLG